MGHENGRKRAGALAGALALVTVCGGARFIAAEEEIVAQGVDATGCVPALAVDATPRWKFAREPKALGAHVLRGLDWIVAHQLADGGFGQGEESESMGASLQDYVAKSDVADTCMATLALVRSGAVPGVEPRGVALARGVAFVCGEIETADEESLFVTSLRGTRVQMKIGTYVDTFLASMLLSEVKERMATPEENARVERALAKVLVKIARNQRDDGGFEGSGWAPVLAQSMASKGINRAYQNEAGGAIELALANTGYFMDRAEADASLIDPSGLGGGSSAPSEAAGVELYALAANLGGLQDFVNSIGKRERELDALFASESDPQRLAVLVEEKKALDEARRVQQGAKDQVVGRLDDPGFVAGFGSNGGEEFLSYMNIAESLVVAGGDVWTKWDESMSANLARVQNEDGSWTGHHCITGRTFVTSAALLTLMADRTPVPVEAVVQAEAPIVERAVIDVVENVDDEE